MRNLVKKEEKNRITSFYVFVSNKSIFRVHTLTLFTLHPEDKIEEFIHRDRRWQGN
jgi:hypothetical protein